MRKLNSAELNRPDLESFRRQDKIPVVFVLDNVRSALNVGSAFRTADGFGIAQVVLCGISAQPPHREILKTALGATDSVSWVYFQETRDALSALKKDGYRIFAIEQTTGSVPLQDFIIAPDEKYALVFGNEVTGVGEAVIALADGCIEIPQSGTKHSLNIAVCAGIVGWEFFKKLQVRR